MMASNGTSEELFKFPVDESSLDPCAICLEKHQDKSFPNNCIHEFCFSCLLRWSKIKPKCPLCAQPFRSIIHNKKSDHEYDEHNIAIVNPDSWSDSEYSESAGDSSSWGTSSESSWVTISSNGEIQIVERTSSHSQNVSHAAERRRFELSEELSEELREPFNYDDFSTDEEFPNASSVINISEPCTGVEYGPSHLTRIFAHQLVLSEQSLEKLDAFLLSMQSDLASNESVSTPYFLPRTSRIGRVSLVVEGGSSVDVTPRGTDAIRGPQCEIVYRCVENYSLPSSDEDVIIESEINNPSL